VRVGAFNIQKFSVRKLRSVSVLEHIVTIVSRYDLVLIQEVIDAEGDVVVRGLVQALHDRTGLPFDYAQSAPCGRTRSKERYAYVYRTDRFRLLESRLYPEPHDEFEREPYIARFAPSDSSSSNSSPAAVLQCIGCHIKPSQASAETGHLSEVYRWALTTASLAADDGKKGTDHQQRAGADWTLLMGDFNASGAYLGKRKQRVLLGSLAPWFDALIQDTDDTTVGVQDLAYDRLFVSKALATRVVPGQPHVYRFDTELSPGSVLPDAKAVSDHYPIQVSLLWPC